MSRPTVGALFAGYCGLELAVQQVWPDAHPAWVSEIDKGPARIIAHHFPDVPNLGDVTKVDWAAVEPVDIIAGGSPCQDLSHAGKRAGMRAGTRSGLWASMCDAIDIIRPRLVVWENVRGALSARADSAVEPCPVCVGDDPGVTLRALGRVLGDLSELGYDAAWTGLRAADVGAPHGRFRVFVLAWRRDDTEPLTWRRDDTEPLTWRRDDTEPLLPTPAAHEPGGTAERYHARLAAHDGRTSTFLPLSMALLPTPRTSDTNGAGQHGDGGLDLRTAVTLLPTPRATDGSKGGPNQRGSSGDLMLPSAVVQLLPTPTAMDHKASGGNPNTTGSHGTTLTDATVRQPDRFGNYAAAIARTEAVLGRPAPDPTEPTGRNGAHRLSPRFVEFMMLLPDGWVTDVPGLTREQILKALGNGVVPAQAAAAVRWLLDVRTTALKEKAA